ncbi:MAG: hypothetical protein Kow0031_26170 [Anaerolineae bacterium]
MLGAVPLALRLPAALLGVLTVAALYPLGRALFAGRRGVAIGLMTMAGLATSAWHLHFSRLGFRAILLPLLAALGMYFFWRMWRATIYDLRFTIYDLMLAALFFALAVYAYLAGRLLLGVPLLFALLGWGIAKISNRAQPGDTRRQLRVIAKLYALILLFLLPLIVYFALNPADFVARAGTVSIFNPEWNRGDLPGTAWRTLTLTLGTFLGLAGDANPLVNLPGQPALPLVAALLFVAGLAVSLVRVARFRADGPAHLLLLCWWAVMLLPALLAPEGAPHHLRLIGTLVPTTIFIAIGLAALCEFVSRQLSVVSRQLSLATCTLLPAALYIFLALQTWNTYFIRWPQQDFTLTFDLYATRLAGQIAQQDAATATVLPMDIRAGDEARHYTLDYLLSPSDAARLYLPVDERNAERVLTAAAAGHDTLRVVRWSADKHLAADEKGIVTFLLRTQAAPLGVESFPVYDIESYAVAPQTTFRLPAINRPIGANFDDLLRLDAVAVPPSAAPGEALPMALTLAPLAPMEADYRASLRLVSPAGERIAQVDRTLRHNFHQGTSLWPPESVNEYFLLPIPPDAAPGEYTVSVVLYHPDTQVPLVAGGVAELPLGAVRLE